LGWWGDPDCSDGIISLTADISCDAVFGVVCSVSEDDLFLPNEVMTGVVLEQSCQTITAQSIITETADVIFEAGHAIRLDNGFTVEQDGTFTAILDLP